MFHLDKEHINMESFRSEVYVGARKSHAEIYF